MKYLILFLIITLSFSSCSNNEKEISNLVKNEIKEELTYTSHFQDISYINENEIIVSLQYESEDDEFFVTGYQSLDNNDSTIAINGNELILAVKNYIQTHKNNELFIVHKEGSKYIGIHQFYFQGMNINIHIKENRELEKVIILGKPLNKIQNKFSFKQNGEITKAEMNLSEEIENDVLKIAYFVEKYK